MKNLQKKLDFAIFEYEELKDCSIFMYRNRINNIDAESHFINFCLQLYHFKDWLIEHNHEKKQIIETYITKSKYLSVIADIANENKHKKLNSKNRSRDIVEKGNNHVFISLTEDNQVVAKSIHEIKINNKKINVVNFSRKCIDEWKKFCEKENINLDFKYK